MKLTICLVEDCEEHRLFVRSTLDGLCDLIEFEDGHSALDALKVVRADLVLLDMSLPGMKSDEVIARLREDPETRALPVIGLAHDARSAERARMLRTGFDDYVTKPVAQEGELFAAMMRCLSPDRREARECA